MGRKLTRKESDLFDYAWVRGFKDGNDFCRCPWCKDPDLEGQPGSGDQELVGCSEASCEFLVGKWTSGGEADLWVHTEILAEIKELSDRLKYEDFDGFEFLANLDQFVSHTIIDGGVGTSWSAGYLWMENPDDEDFKRQLVQYKEKLQNYIALKGEEGEEGEEDEEDEGVEEYAGKGAFHMSAGEEAALRSEIAAALARGEIVGEPSFRIFHYSCGRVSDEIYVYSDKVCPRCGGKHSPTKDVTDFVRWIAKAGH